jgi:hypothetical protein
MTTHPVYPFIVLATGGGCEALSATVGSFLVLVTHHADACIPTPGEPFSVGVYSGCQDDHLLAFGCGDSYSAESTTAIASRLVVGLSCATCDDTCAECDSH